MCFIVLTIHPVMSDDNFLFLEQEHYGIEKHCKKINDNFEWFFSGNQKFL